MGDNVAFQTNGLLISFDSHIASYTGIVFQVNKREQVDWEQFIEEWANNILANARARGVDTTSDNFTLLSLGMPCGNKVSYKTVDDIPRVDTPCPCGDPNHWLVQYRTLD